MLVNQGQGQKSVLLEIQERERERQEFSVYYSYKIKQIPDHLD